MVNNNFFFNNCELFFKNIVIISRPNKIFYLNNLKIVRISQK